MRWWGWGEDAAHTGLPAHALTFLRETVGVADARRAPVALQDVALPAPALGGTQRDALAAIVGADGVRDDRAARVRHAAGKSYPDLVRQRAGTPADAPDAVVAPRSHEEVRAVLERCAEARIAVVPFGGGTSVVGGLDVVRDGFAAAISLDLGRLDRVTAIDERSLTVVAEPGIRGPELEAALGVRGLTLGHFPQSYEYASLGGYVATRSAGQASTGYGRIDELVLGLRLAAPAGEIALAPVPATAAGPGLRGLVVGSEGTLGVITSAALRVAPAPEVRRYEGFAFASFGEGCDTFRRLERQDVAPDVARLSDEEETRLQLALAGTGGLKGRLGRAYMGARGVGRGCIAICGWEGESDEVARRRARSVAVLKAGGAVALGQSPGRAWERGRFAAPYLRDDLLGHGVMVETLETAAQWTDLAGVYRAVGGALRAALAGRGTPPLVLCHVSHLYASGASLYFTFLARQQDGAELEQWRAAKAAACDAIVAGGGTLTHHHAVGRDHVPWMAGEVGDLGVAALRAVKDRLDPAGVMNPGKLLP
jgi:alkyldihydroxyacetonephosphate synthase